MQKNPSATPIVDLISIDSNGKPVLEGVTQKELSRFKQIVAKVGMAVKGTIPSEYAYLGTTTIAGRGLAHYKSWIPGAVKTRYKKLAYDAVTEEFDDGRLRVMFSDLVGSTEYMIKGFRNAIIRSLPIIGYVFSDKLGTNEKYARKLYEEYFAMRPDLNEADFTFEQFIDMRLKKLKAAGTEIQSTILFFLIALMLKAMAPDEDEDAVAILAHQNLYRLLYKSYVELSFFTNPLSISEILESPFPAISTLNNIIRAMNNTLDESRDIVFGEDYKGSLIWEEDKDDTSPIGKYSTKLIPGVNAALGVLDVYDTFSYNNR